MQLKKTIGLFAAYLQTAASAAVMEKIAADTSRVRSSPAFLKDVIAANGMEDLPLQGAALAKRFQQSREDFASRIKGLDLQLR